MKATKVIMPNGKERILIEVKPKEYEAISKAFTDSYMVADGAAEKEDKRVEVFDKAQTSTANSFDGWLDIKFSE